LPGLLLPTKDSDPMVSIVEAHLVTGSEREKEKDGSLGDYVDGCANHLLLADGYSILAEMECGENRAAIAFAFDAVEESESGRMGEERERSVRL